MARRHSNTVQNPIVTKIFLIIFGLIFAIVPLWSVIPIAFEDQLDDGSVTYEKIEAEISNIEIDNKLKDTHYYVFVTYEYNGEKYKDIQLDRYDSSMYEGKQIEIKVDVNNHTNIKGVGVMGQPNYILLLAAVPFLIIGIVVVIVGIKYNPEKKGKKGYGRYETPSEFTGVQSETNYRNNTYGTMNSQSNGTYGTMNSQRNNTYGNMNGAGNSSSNDNYGFDNFGNDDFFGDNNLYGNAGNSVNKIIRNNKELLKTGRRMTGVVEKIENNTDFRGNEFLKVFCSCFDVASNTSYRYSSEDIPVSEGIDPTVMPGGMLDVYVNPNNLGEYYVSVPRDNRENSSVNPIVNDDLFAGMDTNFDSNIANGMYTGVNTNVNANNNTSANSNANAGKYASLDPNSREKNKAMSLEEMYNARK